LLDKLRQKSFVKPLYGSIDHVRHPRGVWIFVYEVVKLITMQAHKLPAPALELVFALEFQAYKVRNSLRIPIVVASYPNYLNILAHPSQQRQHTPVTLLKPAEIKIVKKIPVDNELLGLAVDQFKKSVKLFAFANVAAQMSVAYYD